MTSTLTHSSPASPAARPPDGDSADRAPDPRPRTLWKRILFGAGIVVALASFVVGIDFVLSGTKHTTAVFDQPVGTIHIEVDGGDVTIVGTTESTTAVEFESHGGLRKPSNTARVDGDTLWIDSDCGYAILSPTCGADIVVRAPAGATVIARGNGTDYDMSEIAGDVDVNLNGGRARLEFSGGPDRVRARSNGGSITIVVPDDATAYRVRATSDGGSTSTQIRTDPAGDHDIDAHANGGSITIRYPDPSGS